MSEEARQILTEAFKLFAVGSHFPRQVSRSGEGLLHTGIIGIFKEIRPVGTDEAKDLHHSVFAAYGLQVRHHSRGIRIGPELLEAVHSLLDLIAVVATEKDSHLVLGAQPVIDLAVAATLLVLRQKSRYIFLKIKP